MLAFAAFALHLIGRSCPDRVADRLIGLFMKTLAQKLRAGWSPLDKRDRPTGSPDGGDADGMLHLSGRLTTVPLSAEGHEQPGRQHRSCPGEPVKNRRILVLREQFRNGRIIHRDALANGEQQIRQQGGFQDRGLHEGRIGGEWFSRSNPSQPVGDHVRLPPATSDVNAAQLLRIRLFEGVKTGIGEQQVTGHGGKAILAADLQEQRIILFEQVGELMAEAGAMVDSLAASPRQSLQGASQRGIRGEPPEMVAVQRQQVGAAGRHRSGHLSGPLTCRAWRYCARVTGLTG